MRISLNWLRELVDVPDPGALPARLTFAGLEVEGVEELGTGLAHVVVARLLESQPHPQADRLSVTQVDAGPHGRRQIVCGAKNYRVGDLVALALPGAQLPNDLAIATTELRGVTSQGMLCSQRELGLTAGLDDASGLFLLPRGLPGELLTEALPLRDTVYTLNVTPNRADCLSHLGVSREVAALFAVPRRAPPAGPALPALDDRLAAPGLSAEAVPRCGRLLTQAVEIAGAAAPSPFWLQARLAACGVRPIGLAVDVTSYVMLELGQPLHAYDRDRLAHGLGIRLARSGERLTTLDGAERQLDPDDLLIVDGDAAVGLAGVMGGAASAVGPQTRALLIEAAYFAPAGIRRSAKRHSLPSEAAHRFERGVDPELPRAALARALDLLAQLGASGASEVREARGQLSGQRTVPLAFAKVGRLLGRPVEGQEVLARLASVGVPADAVRVDGAEFAIPSHRADLIEAVDLIAEVGRLGGFEATVPQAPAQSAAPPRLSAREVLRREVRAGLLAAGFAETVQLSFRQDALTESFSPGAADGRPVRLQNPLRQEQGAMRRSLLPGLCDNLGRTLAHLTRDAGVAPTVRLFEIGRTYRWPAEGERPRPDGPAVERPSAALVWHGPRFPLGWATSREPADIYDLFGVLDRLFGALRRPLERRPTARSYLHPRSACELWCADLWVGVAGELHPAVAERAELPRQALLAELDLEAIGGVPARALSGQVPAVPAVLRDLALVVAEALPAQELADRLREAGRPLLEELTLFDVYRGAPLASGEKSLAYSLRFRAPDRTLTDPEVAGQLQAMLAAAQGLGGRLRS